MFDRSFPRLFAAALASVLTCLIAAPLAAAQTSDVEEITLTASDGLEVTADVVAPAAGSAERARWIVLAHMAGASRGEYRETAARLAKAGYATLALDQRSGSSFAGVRNLTAARAKKAGLGAAFSDAKPDIIAGLDYAKAKSGRKAVLIGSSYSAALAIVIAAERPDLVAAAAAMSPGEFLNVSVADAAKRLQAPVLIMSPRGEAAGWAGIAEAARGATMVETFTPAAGRHGASSLIPALEPSAEAYWAALDAFLARNAPHP